MMLQVFKTSRNSDSTGFKASYVDVGFKLEEFEDFRQLLDFFLVKDVTRVMLIQGTTRVLITKDDKRFLAFTGGDVLPKASFHADQKGMDQLNTLLERGYNGSY